MAQSYELDCNYETDNNQKQLLLLVIPTHHVPIIRVIVGKGLSPTPHIIDLLRSHLDCGYAGPAFFGGRELAFACD